MATAVTGSRPTRAAAAVAVWLAAGVLTHPSCLAQNPQKVGKPQSESGTAASEPFQPERACDFSGDAEIGAPENAPAAAGSDVSQALVQSSAGESVSTADTEMQVMRLMMLAAQSNPYVSKVGAALPLLVLLLNITLQDTPVYSISVHKTLPCDGTVPGPDGCRGYSVCTNLIHHKTSCDG